MTERLTEQAAYLQKAVTSLVKKYQFRDRNDICAYGISVSQYYTYYHRVEFQPTSPVKG
jgi:hypothetical protein